MNVVGIIPARYGSTRLPGKPLEDICGKPMIWWVYERIKDLTELSAVYAAIDDPRVEECCIKYSIPYVMTRSDHPTGANRLQEVSEKIGADFYIQINGDEPLIDREAVSRAVPDTVPYDIEFGTNIIAPVDEASMVVDPTNIKMVFDKDMYALYMSRTPVPYPYKDIDFKYYKHIGIIGYNKKMLDFYRDSVPGRFEKIEGIDTLRFLDYGKKLKLIEISKYNSLSVDTIEDLEYVRKIIRDGLKNG